MASLVNHSDTEDEFDSDEYDSDAGSKLVNTGTKK
jgi:hypothetical protein